MTCVSAYCIQPHRRLFNFCVKPSGSHTAHLQFDRSRFLFQSTQYPTMADIQAIADQFIAFYYQTFDTNRAGLQSLYRDHSMLTWESTPLQGASAIAEKLVSLPFEKVQHKVITTDAQPSSPTEASIIVSVTGQLLVDDSTNPLNFSQVFQLIPESGSYYVFNDIFRLNYG